MTLKKNPGAPKKQVKATISECKAENPLKCKFHGPKQLNAELGKVIGTIPFTMKKRKDGYDIALEKYPPKGTPQKLHDLINQKKKIGYVVSGIYDDGKYHLYIKFDDGQFDSPEGEDEKQDADTLSSEEAPNTEVKIANEDNLGEEFDLSDFDEDMVEFSDFEDDMVEGVDEENENPPEVTENQVYDFLTKIGYEPEKMSQEDISLYMDMINNGLDFDGEVMGKEKIDAWKDSIKGIDSKDPVVKKIKDTIKKIEKGDIKIIKFDDGFTDDEISNWMDNNSNIKYIFSLGEIKNLLKYGVTAIGDELTETQKDFTKKIIERAGSSPISNAILAKLGLNQDEKGQDGFKEEITDEEWKKLAASVKKSPYASYTFWESIPDIVMGNILKTADWHDPFEDSEPLSSGNQVTYKNFLQFVSSSTGSDSKFTKAMMKAYKSHQNYDMDGLDEIVSEKGSGLEVAKMKSQWNSINTDNIEVLHQINNSPSSKSNDKFKDAIADATGTFVFAAQNKDISGMSGAIAKLKSTIDGWKNKVSAKKKLFDALTDDKPMVEKFKELMKPLEHDDGKFPPDLSQERLEYAIENGKETGGNGGLGTKIVEIGGKKYVCKSGVGKAEKIIRNGYNADMAYRAGGIYAPDSKLYEFGDGKVYKLSEFIEGDRLIDVWKNADEKKRKEIRKELLKGYPLDVLFSNYDVLGTSQEESQKVYIEGKDGEKIATYVAFDNVILGKDGHAYRIDNDGSFAMTGKGAEKNSTGGIFTTPVDFEHWDNWNDRQWIDDFRTMRRNEKNQGIFDRYSTADIFISAGNINLDQVVSTLPEDIQQALKKPLFEMKQMTMRTLSANISGIRNNHALSVALDASYEASKKKFRELCIGEISFSSGGIGSKKSNKGDIPPYPVKKPDPPENPEKAFMDGVKLSNAEYVGSKVSEIIIKAAKTINYHAGFIQTDVNGNKIGGGNAMNPPDFNPNSSKIADFKRIDREKLLELSKTDDNAKKVLDYYDSVATSIDNGYTQPVQEVKLTSISTILPSGFKTKQEIEFEKNKSKVMGEYKSALEKYNTEILPHYYKEKKEWEDAEKKKLESGEKGLDGNFYDIANEFMEAAYDTNGIAKNNGENIDFIELGKYQNKYGGGISGSTTHNDSWTPASSRLKVLELLMRGMSIDEIIGIGDKDQLINNGHWSGDKAKKWFIGEAKKLKDDKDMMNRQLEAYAVFKALQVVKLENETADIKLPDGGTVSWINHQSHSVALIRKEDYNNAKINTVAPTVQKGANTSCGFQSNGCINEYPYAYEVPLWNISYTYSDENHKGATSESYKGSEHEWVASLVGITPFRVDSAVNASKNIQLMRSCPMIKEQIENRMDRMSPFYTTIEELKKFSSPH